MIGILRVIHTHKGKLNVESGDYLATRRPHCRPGGYTESKPKGGWSAKQWSAQSRLSEIACQLPISLWLLAGSRTHSHPSMTAWPWTVNSDPPLACRMTCCLWEACLFWMCAVLACSAARFAVRPRGGAPASPCAVAAHTTTCACAWHAHAHAQPPPPPTPTTTSISTSTSSSSSSHTLTYLLTYILGTC